MVGLANQLPVASLLLIQEDINAVVVTEFMPFKLSPQCPPLASFVEASLFCPLSMVSTMYGLRLANQLDLGSPVPIRCHDHLAVGSTKLQCKKTPNSFSTNMNSDTSTELIGIIKSMGRSCFIPVPNLGLGLRVIEGVLSSLYVFDLFPIQQSSATNFGSIVSTTAWMSISCSGRFSAIAASSMMIGNLRLAFLFFFSICSLMS